jgi:hypothetical protein
MGHEVAGIFLQPPAHERFLQGPAILAPRRHDLHPEMPHLVGGPVARPTLFGGWLGLRTLSSELS